MAYEVRDLKQTATGSKIWPKYEVYDRDGSTTFSISSVSYQFIDMSSASVTLSGSVPGSYINNSDTDASGATIKTFQVPLDLTSGVSAGYYVLVLTVTLTCGEIQKFRVIYDVSNFEEVF